MDGRTDRQTDGQTNIHPLAIPAVCIARYANALVKIGAFPGYAHTLYPPPPKKILYTYCPISLLLLYCTILFIIIVVVVVVVVIVIDQINMVQTQQRSGPRYKVNVTNAVIVRKSWKTDTSSTMYGDAYIGWR